MYSDSEMEQLIDNNQIRPVRGSLWCEKYIPGKASVEVRGLGMVDFTDVTESGIILVASTTKESDSVTANLYIVRAMGSDPDKWSSRWTQRDLNTWENPRKSDMVWNENWASQHIGIGTLIAIRAGSGANQETFSKFLQVRYDEIVAIGTELASDEIPMLPAPGWVMIQKDENTGVTASGIYRGEGQVYEKGWVLWGRVIGLPLGYEDDDLHVSDHVAIPLHYGAGASEYIEFEGTIRCVPMDDVLIVELSEEDLDV